MNKVKSERIIQVHWQHPVDFDKTELVAQGGEFESYEQMHGWIRAMLEQHADTCPDGWIPMICNELSEHFVWAAPKQLPEAERMGL